MPINHIIDPTYFYDAIEEFSFNYDWYVITNKGIDEWGRETTEFTKKIIRGSLQTQGNSIVLSKNGNHQQNDYNFYCKSLYRINIGDFIFYKETWLHVNNVHEYDEYGVRECTLKMVNLNNYRDLKEYVDFLEGNKIV